MTKASTEQIGSFLPMSNATSQFNVTPMTTAITIRPAYADDELALHRLAELDSADLLPQSPLLIAEADGELRVALSLSDGTAIADPFFPTAAIVALMRRHAEDLVPARTGRLGARVAAWLRARRGLAGLQGAGAPSA
jgi:hypothetical protein